MMLATTKVEDFDRFLKIFSTKGAEKRKQHGSKGCDRLPRSQRDRPGLGDLRLGRRRLQASFVSDPEVPAIIQEAGHKGKPEAPKLVAKFDA